MGKGTTTISVSADVKQRFDTFFNKRRYEETQKGVKGYRASDSLKELMDMANIPEVKLAGEPNESATE